MPKTIHEQLVEAVRTRTKQTEFNGGIVTADRYLRTLQECVGSDACYKFTSKGTNSFQDQLTKAANVLTYNNEDMLVDEQIDFTKGFNVNDLYDVPLEMPKNALMVFRHTLTTPRKDRDGDILRTQGAKPDPKMLLLFQHTHTLPIGKMLGIAEHNKHRLDLYSAIIDMNELSHDSAVMVDNNMGRFSHGFRALEFSEVKEDHGKTTSPGGFDIKSFEIMEESLVSVPSNTDAQVDEVLLSLVESKKMTSPLMRSYGKEIRSKRNTTMNIPLDLAKLEKEHEISTSGDDESRESKSEHSSGTKCSCGGKESEGTDSKPAPEKANGESESEEKATTHGKVGECPECGAKMVGGVCEKCGYGETKKETDVDGEKAGRTISTKNLANLTQARDHVHEVHEKEHLITRGGKSLCKEARDLIDGVIKSAVKEETERDVEITVKDAMAVIIAKANSEDRDQLFNVLQTMKDIDKRDQRTKSVQALLGNR